MESLQDMKDAFEAHLAAGDLSAAQAVFDRLYARALRHDHQPAAVAWRYRHDESDPWSLSTSDPNTWAAQPDIVEPLYAGPHLYA
jgi:hypothetical protein